MAKTKRGPSLFEILRKDGPPSQDARLDVPGWWSRGEDRGRQRTSSAPPPSEGVRPTGESDGKAPLVAVDGPRLVLSFTSLTASMGVLLLIVVITGAFFIGRHRGLVLGRAEGFASGKAAIGEEVLDDIEKARRSKPKEEIFAGMSSSPVQANNPQSLAAVPAGRKGAPAAEPEDGPKWVRGHTYIVVQEFLETDLEEARKAREFLEEHGVATSIVQYRGRSKYKYRLVTQKGFNCDDPVQKQLCDEYHQQIRKLGELFVKAGGRYDLQGYQKKAIGTP